MRKREIERLREKREREREKKKIKERREKERKENLSFFQKEPQSRLPSRPAKIDRVSITLS